jgi:hypothetical protein
LDGSHHLFFNADPKVQMTDKSEYAF